MPDSVRGAGLRHAWIRIAAGTYIDIDASMSVEGEGEIEDTEVEGDDAVLAVFASKPTKTLTIEANALTPAVIAAITGESVATVTITGPPAYAGEEVALGTAGETNPPFVEVGAYTVAKKKSDGNNAVIQRIFHKTQLRVTSITQEKDGEFSVNMEGTAYPTAKDITGTALASERVDTLRYTNQDADTLAAAQAV